MKKKKRLEIGGSYILEKNKNSFTFKGPSGKTILPYKRCDRFGTYFFKKNGKEFFEEAGYIESYQKNYTELFSKTIPGRSSRKNPQKIPFFGEEAESLPQPLKEGPEKNPLGRSNEIGSGIEEKRPFLKGGCSAILEKKIRGCQYGYVLFLKLVGLGYKFSLYPSRQKEETMVLSIKAGWSHKVKFFFPTSLGIYLFPRNLLALFSPEEEIVRNIAYQIRRQRPPTPYKGKGIRFSNESILLKVGKKTK